jgi:hypothetical protein
VLFRYQPRDQLRIKQSLVLAALSLYYLWNHDRLRKRDEEPLK